MSKKLRYVLGGIIVLISLYGIVKNSIGLLRLQEKSKSENKTHHTPKEKTFADKDFVPDLIMWSNIEEWDHIDENHAEELTDFKFIDLNTDNFDKDRFLFLYNKADLSTKVNCISTLITSYILNKPSKIDTFVLIKQLISTLDLNLVTNNKFKEKNSLRKKSGINSLFTLFFL